MQRIDRKDRYFVTAEEQYDAALEETLVRHEKGQPVLVVAATIQDTQIFSRMLVKHQVPHSVLNANNVYWEAEIIAEAGQRDAVTVSTGMAGRGTDIKLGKGIKELGGLAVIGIGRMSNVRLERQARGRAGRQGDPGSSQFFVSLEDEIVHSMRGEKVEKYIEGERHVSRRKLRRLIDGAQETMEEQAVASREQSVRYDEVLRRQRDILYDARDRLLNRESISKETIQAIVRDNLARFIETHPDMHESDLNRFILDNLSYELDVERVHITGEGRSARKHLLESLVSYAGELFEKKRELFAGENQFQDYVRHCILIAMSDAWTEEVDYLQQLQFATMTRGTAQRNPVFEYSREAYKSFNDMKNMMKRDIARNFFLGDPQYDDKGEMHIILP